MGPGDVDVGLGDDAHAEVVEGAGPEAGEGRGEGDGAVTASKADGNLKTILCVTSFVFRHSWPSFY